MARHFSDIYRIDRIPAWWLGLFSHSLSLAKTEDIGKLSYSAQLAWRLFLILGIWFAVLRVWARARPDLFAGLSESQASAGLVLEILYVAPFAISHFLAGVVSWSGRKSIVVWFNFFLSLLTANLAVGIPGSAVLIWAGAFAISPSDMSIIEAISVLPQDKIFACIAAISLPLLHYWMSYFFSLRNLIDKNVFRRIAFLAVLAIVYFPVSSVTKEIYHDVHYRGSGTSTAIFQAIDETLL